ncbi:MAG TPA: rhomboid family intramembrane serine protease [Clostridia bacterium]|nr:rhomboid family intramembrane serine protease [Clostridia bacterium]
MDQAGTPGGLPDPSHQGQLSRAEAAAMLEHASALLAAGDFPEAGAYYNRLVGTGDAAMTAAALLGRGEVRYRLDDDAGALADWKAVLRLPETASTYPAWRNVAAAQVRAGDLSAAMDAYRQAERRAPPEDRPEIANRLGWLSKELGDRRAAGRYFARGRGDLGFTLSRLVIAVTVVISLTASYSAEGGFLFDTLALDKFAVADGEYWRLWTVTLLHADLIHLGFNMYALWIVGPLVERWYGGVWFLIFYLACAATGSVASFAFGGDIPAVGASGAVFGLFGILAAASRVHQPVDRQARAIASQIGMIILINLAFGFASGGRIDNAAHIGGLVGGLWFGAILPPTRVSTLASYWRRAGTGGMVGVTQSRAGLPVVAVAVVVLVVLAGILYGTDIRDGRRAALDAQPGGAPPIVAIREAAAP